MNNMIFIKSFIRKKSTKIFLIIFVTMLLSINYLNIVRDYYDEQMNEYYRDSSYYLILSKNDILNDLKNEEIFIRPKEVIVLTSIDNKIDDSYISDRTFAEGEQDFVIIESGAQDTLKDDEVYIKIPEFYLGLQSYQNLTSKKIIINLNGQKEFKIKDYKADRFSRIIVSRDIFEEAKKDSEYFSYTIKINDYKDIPKIEKKLESIDESNHTYVQVFKDSKEIKMLEELKDTLNLIGIVIIILIIIFIIIYIIIVFNLISEEVDNMSIENLIGYNHKQIKRIVLTKKIFLDILSFIIYFIINFIILFILNHKMNIEIINIKLYCISLLVMIISLLISYATIMLKIKKSLFTINKKSIHRKSRQNE